MFFKKKLTYILLHIQLLSTKQVIGNDARCVVWALCKFFFFFFSLYFLILLIFYCIYISFNLWNSMNQDGQWWNKGLKGPISREEDRQGLEMQYVSGPWVFFYSSSGFLLLTLYLAARLVFRWWPCADSLIYSIYTCFNLVLSLNMNSFLNFSCCLILLEKPCGKPWLQLD